MTGKHIFAAIPESWMVDAKCRGRDPEDYDSMKVKGPDGTIIDPRNAVRHKLAAQALCRGCPVIGECAEFALRTEASGVIHAGIPLAKKGDPVNQLRMATLRSIAAQKNRRRSL